MAQKVLQIIKLHIPAGGASPAPPVGPALGGASINIMEFCKAFNAQTQNLGGVITPVEISVYEDRSFSFITKTPPASVLIKEAIKLKKGSAEPHRDKVASITRAQLQQRTPPAQRRPAEPQARRSSSARDGNCWSGRC